MFYTKFNLPARTLREMDTHDNVDRLSYTDTSVMIKRFTDAGKLLQLRNNPAYMMYQTPEQVEAGVGIPSQVYATDPVYAAESKQQLEEIINEQLEVAETGGSAEPAEAVPTVAGDSTSANNDSNLEA